MKKIPFDIKYRPEIESGKYKVVTKDGNPVRLLSWEAKGNYPIVGLVEENHIETPESWCMNGYYTNRDDSSLNLFIITDEPELTEFEENLRQVIIESLSGETPNGSGGTISWAVALSDDDVRKLAPKVMELVKKELLKQWNIDMKNEYKRGKRDGFTIGYNKAMKENNESVAYHFPTYGPPCHHGGICTNPFKDCINCPRNLDGFNTATTTSGTCKKED